MATYGLISPLNTRGNHNPGSQFITDGLRWLIRQFDPAACFVPVDLLADDPDGWLCLTEQADVALLCGNPRFNLDERGVYWDLDIWERILVAHDAGVPFVDAWAGSAHPFPLKTVDEMAEAIARLNKTKRILSYETRAALCIARDRVAEELLKSANSSTVLLPCSSWYAAQFHHVAPAEKDRHCITLRKMPGYGWIIERALDLQRELQRELPTYILVHSMGDFQWVTQRRRIRDLKCIEDPQSLLQFYARVDKLLTFRIHGAIPGLALGARVCNLSLDSRSLTVDEFGLESVPFTRLEDSSFEPEFRTCANPPGVGETIEALRSTVQACLVASGEAR